MEKNNGKVIAIVALFVAVVALSIGFAAFTDTLTISGTATVNKADNVFAQNFAYDSASEEECHYSTGSDTLGSGTYNAGTSSDNTWSGISVPLTETHPSVTCTAKIKNNSDYDAYLKTLTVNGGIQCTSTGADAATNTTEVCHTVKATVQIGSSANELEITDQSTSSSAASNLNLKIDKKTNNVAGEATVTLIIEYDTDTAPTPDGDITVTLPTISHGYSTAS